MKRSRSAFALILSLIVLSSHSAQATPLEIESGLVEGLPNGAVQTFKGIPYAAAPVGDRRWRAPEAAPRWSGVKPAKTFSPICPQIGTYPDDAPKEPMSEDCLALNIWTPNAASSAQLPVMVWIHGGGLAMGSGSVPIYDGTRLASRGVVVVTFNYRLGALGFLAHPELNKEAPHGGSGNYGLLDQVAALNWVKRNILAFGGDPNQVTVFGQSSGAMSISMLTASPLANGLFKRAIAQSGGVFEPVELDPKFSPQGAAESGQRFAARASAAALADLRKRTADQILTVPFHPQFNIDGHALTKPPFNVYATAAQNKVDLILGTNADEGEYFLGKTPVTVANFHDVLGQHFPSWLVWVIGASPGNTNAEARASASKVEGDMRFRWDMWKWTHLSASTSRSRVFFYHFTHTPPVPANHPLAGLGATHGVEMAYVFDNLDHQQGNWTDKDRALASSVSAYWMNFAKTGNPNGANLPQWPEFRTAPNKAMELGDTITPAEIPGTVQLERIDAVYATVRFIIAKLYPLMAAGGIALLLIVAWIVARLRRRQRT